MVEKGWRCVLLTLTFLQRKTGTEALESGKQMSDFGPPDEQLTQLGDPELITLSEPDIYIVCKIGIMISIFVVMMIGLALIWIKLLTYNWYSNCSPYYTCALTSPTQSYVTLYCIVYIVMFISVIMVAKHSPKCDLKFKFQISNILSIISMARAFFFRHTNTETFFVAYLKFKFSLVPGSFICSIWQAYYSAFIPYLPLLNTMQILTHRGVMHSLSQLTPFISLAKVTGYSEGMWPKSRWI